MPGQGLVGRAHDCVASAPHPHCPQCAEARSLEAVDGAQSTRSPRRCRPCHGPCSSLTSGRARTAGQCGTVPCPCLSHAIAIPISLWTRAVESVDRRKHPTATLPTPQIAATTTSSIMASSKRAAARNEKILQDLVQGQTCADCQARNPGKPPSMLAFFPGLMPPSPSSPPSPPLAIESALPTPPFPSLRTLDLVRRLTAKAAWASWSVSLDPSLARNRDRCSYPEAANASIPRDSSIPKNATMYADTCPMRAARRVSLHAMCCNTSQAGDAHLQSQVPKYGQLVQRTGRCEHASSSPSIRPLRGGVFREHAS